MNSIRLIIEKPSVGALNMAVDQSILDSVNQLGMPTLRFYSWLPATLSLGYFQAIEARQSHLESLSAPLVRRASGGGAILHDHEITYSIVIPSNDRWSSRNTELYRLAHAAVIEVLSNYDVRLQAYDKSHPPGSSNHFLCFKRRSDGDLLLDNHKVVGSAQRRAKDALLQHGSILLKRSSYAPQLPGIFDLAGFDVPENDLVQQFSATFCRHLGFDIEIGKLSGDEIDLAQQIKTERFESAKWTEKQRSKSNDSEYRR